MHFTTGTVTVSSFADLSEVVSPVVESALEDQIRQDVTGTDLGLSEDWSGLQEAGDAWSVPEANETRVISTVETTPDSMLDTDLGSIAVSHTDIRSRLMVDAGGISADGPSDDGSSFDEHVINLDSDHFDLAGMNDLAIQSDENVANTITVSSSTELSQAISTLSAGSGGTIRVKVSDDLYTLDRWQVGSDSGTIQIIADDSSDRPVFSNVRLMSSKNITIKGVDFDSSDVGDRPGMDLDMSQCRNIKVLDSRFVSGCQGFVTNIAEAGKSLAVIQNSKDIVFSGNEISNYYQGLAVIDTVGVKVLDNTFSKMSGDGMRLSGVQDMLIEGNEFGQFYGSINDINHDDMIQVWSAPYNKLNTENLTIRDNIFNSSGGAASQTIFIKNETFGSTGVAFKNITIENNTIFNGHQHGITLYHADGATIRDNTLLWNKNATMQASIADTPYSLVPRINLTQVENAVVTGNITGGLWTDGAGFAGNVFVNYTNPNDPDYVANHFVNVLNPGRLDLRDLALTLTSAWNGHYGSAATQARTSGPLQAVIQQDAAGVTHTYESLSYDPSGLLDQSEARFTWLFGDGIGMTGHTVSRSFNSAGEHDVTLIVTTEDGSWDIVTRITEVTPDVLLDLDFDGKVADASDFGSTLTASAGGLLAKGLSGHGYRLDGTTKVVVDRSNDQFDTLESFTIDLALQRAANGDAGTFLHLHDSFTAAITADGALKFGMSPGNKVYTAMTKAGLISDTKWHQITVTYDGTATGTGLRLYVDGKLQASVSGARGVLDNNGAHNLVIGNTWNQSLQGTVDELEIRASVWDPKAPAVSDIPYYGPDVFVFESYEDGWGSAIEKNGDIFFLSDVFAIGHEDLFL